MALRSFRRFISHRRCPKKHDTIRLIAGDVDVHSGRITGHSLPRQRGHRPFRDDDLSRAPAMVKPPALKNESVHDPVSVESRRSRAPTSFRKQYNRIGFELRTYLESASSPPVNKGQRIKHGTSVSWTSASAKIFVHDRE